MDLKKLLDNVLALGSNISIKDGKEIYKNRLVSNLSSKKINDIYNLLYSSSLTGSNHSFEPFTAGTSIAM